jgi:hypothetical protein
MYFQGSHLKNIVLLREEILLPRWPGTGPVFPEDMIFAPREPRNTSGMERERFVGAAVSLTYGD